MAYLKYTGTAHYRILDSADLKKFGVKGFRKTTWAMGEALEVDDSVAEALIDNLGDEFDLVDEAEAPEREVDQQDWVERQGQGQTEAPEATA